jgi:uncharacterized protein YcbX
MSEKVGVVSELWRYPVQSLRGEKLGALQFTARGALGDRGYCVAEADTGAAGTAARPPWRMLVTWSARFLTEPQEHEPLPKVEISFPDGARVNSDDAEVHAMMSERIGRPVRLAVSHGADVTMPYVASHCHLLTSATLKALSARYPSGRFVSERFRPNVVLECGETTGFIENGWLGTDLSVGGLTLDVNEHCERCALTTRPQGDLPMDPGILHTALQFNNNNVGIYGAVRQPGRVKLGDAATR